MWLTQEIRTPAIVCRISHFNQTMRHHHHPQFSIFGQNVAMYAFSWVKFKKLGILLAWNFWQIPLLNTQEPIQSFKQSLYLIKFASTCFMLSELFGFRMLQTYNVVFVLSTGIDKQCLNYWEWLKAKTNIFEKILLSHHHLKLLKTLLDLPLLAQNKALRYLDDHQDRDWIGLKTDIINMDPPGHSWHIRTWSETLPAAAWWSSCTPARWAGSTWRGWSTWWGWSTRWGWSTWRGWSTLRRDGEHDPGMVNMVVVVEIPEISRQHKS